MKIHKYILACIIGVALLGATNWLHAQTAVTPKAVTAADQQQMLAAKEAYLKAHPEERAKANVGVAATPEKAKSNSGATTTNAWGIGDTYDADKKLKLLEAGKLTTATPGSVHNIDRKEFEKMPKEKQDMILANPAQYKFTDQ